MPGDDRCRRSWGSRIMETFLVGVLCAFDCLVSDGKFGVFRKIYPNSGRVSYTIAPVPSIRARDEPPATILHEFDTEAEAVHVFSRWKEDPLSAQRVRRKKKQPPDPAQTELNLGPLKTKEQAD